MLCEWDLAQMLAGSLGLKSFNVQLMHKIHSLSLPRLASLELPRWEYFYMTVLVWVSCLPGLSPHHHRKLSSVFRINEPGCQLPWGSQLAGSSSFLGPQRDSLGQGQHPIPLVSLGKTGE